VVVAVPLEPGHWPQVTRIYAAGIAGGQATFESAPPTWEAFDASKLVGHRWVAVDDAYADLDPGADGGPVLGWVAATAVSDRCVYAGVVEHSVYVDPSAQGRGVGRRLLEALVESTEQAGIWTIQSGVFPENAASLALHEAAGFRVVGTRRHVARMGHDAPGALAGRWRDVVLLERRSVVVGTS